MPESIQNGSANHEVFRNIKARCVRFRSTAVFSFLRAGIVVGVAWVLILKELHIFNIY